MFIIMDIKEASKKMTREEFLDYSNGTCIRRYGIEISNKDCEGKRCCECRIEQVKDIKFKGEEETLKAICINDQTEAYHDYKGNKTAFRLHGLTKDKTYEVKQSEQYERYYDVLRNDLGIKQKYKKERFEVVDKKPGEIIQEFNKKRKAWFKEAMEHIEPIIKEKLEKAINNYLEGEKVEESIKHTGETAKSIGESFKIIKVRCIKNYNGQLDISIDKEYPIDKEEESFYYIKDDKGINKKYSKFLFEKVEDVLMVECIENDNIEGKLTINKVYLVLKIEDDLYLIKDDLGQTLKLAQSRFKTVEPQKEYTVMELLDFPVGTKLKDNENNIVEIIESIGGTKEDKEIRCTWISKDSPFGNSLILSTGWKRKRFTLVEQPKTVTTSEAFKALEEGKIIESLVTHDRYSKGVKTINIELHDEREEGFNKCMNISIAELEGQWIIIESEGK